MLRARTTSLSIVLASARLTTTIGSAVSRWANVRGGGVNLNTGSLRGAGDNSYYWSATTYPNATNAYDLDFNSTNVLPSDYYRRFYGFSVRGGYIGLHTGSLRNAGFDGFFWSATTYPSATRAYDLGFNSTNVLPSHYYGRFLGFSVQ